ncbi:tyrosine-type recombinase/integrase [Nonomuraea angiospora]|uniref:tyrosine-type recombinase/integrase n=1 Tax=Nonomuraea angiospora TaxID=46172 RepID=UPI0029B293EF|nr:site-specific integrase [Nonomuraea angiospora]MDX3106083.1 site-specific integrase [Nonomuraea angiospora]
MASIETRKGTKATTYRVTWVTGGKRGGARDSETCDTYTIARRFKALVEAAGEQRPAGYPKRCRGIGIDQRLESEPAPAAAADASSPPAAADVPTLGEVLDRYLNQPNHPAEEVQRIGYRRQFNRHVRTAIVTLEDGTSVGPLGGLPITEYTADVDQAWVTWMQGRKHWVKGELVPYSAKTIHNIHGGIISPTLAYASVKGLIEGNPCDSVRLPDKSVRAVTRDEVPTAEEIAFWIALAYQVSELAGDLVTLAIATGLRFGELTALRRCDVDLKRRLLTVAGAIKERREPRELYRANYGKTDTALRTIRIPKSALFMLQRRMENLLPQGLLFTAPKGGILHSNGWSRTWTKVIDLAQESGILTAATLHKMRHFHATELLAANVSMDTVSRRLGHASVLVTSAIYGHLTPEADHRAADVLDAVMGGSKPKKRKKKNKKEKKAVANLLQAVPA